MARTTTFTEQHRVDKVKEFLDSGLTASEFCRRQGIADSTFSVWTKRLAPCKKSGPHTKLVRKQKQKPNSQPQIKIAFAPVKLLEPRTAISVSGRQQLNAHSSLAMEIVLPSGALIRLANDCSQSFVAAALAAIAVQ